MTRYDTTTEPLKIDVRDKKLLVLLAEDARMPISEMAKRLKIGRDTLAYRIGRLEKLGAISQSAPILDFNKLGYNLYEVFLLIDDREQEKVIAALKEHANTVSVIEYSDRWDLQWKLIARDIKELDDIVREVLARFQGAIMERATLLAFDEYESIPLPFVFPRLVPARKHVVREEQTLDAIDLQILERLGKDCRQSTYEIAKSVPVSADTVGLRMKRLVASGIILRYSIIPNYALLDQSWYTFALRLKSFDEQHEMRFREFVRLHPQIVKAFKVLGPYDLLLYVIAQEPKQFHATIKEIKHEFADIVKQYDTFVAYREHTFNPVPRVLVE